MKVSRILNGISLSLTYYIERMLHEFDCYKCKPIFTPYYSSNTLKKNKDEPISQLKYSQLIGSLIYISNRIRPDISYSASRLSRYISNPSTEYWNALERLFRYLRGTIGYYLIYIGYPDAVEG